MAEESEDQGDKNVPKDEESSRDEADTVDDEEETVDSDDAEEEEDDDEGEEEEPKLKYARLTSHLVPVYRNGDATSSFLVAGDKMVSDDGLASLKPY